MSVRASTFFVPWATPPNAKPASASQTAGQSAGIAMPRPCAATAATAPAPIAAAAIAGAALLAVAVQGLGLALPALWLSYGFFIGCAFAGGLAHGLKNVMFRSLIHLRIQPDVHGRAFAAFNGLRNTAELAAFGVGGLLVAAIGAQATLAYAGGLSALCGVAGLVVLLRRNRGWVSTSPVGARPAAQTG